MLLEHTEHETGAWVTQFSKEFLMPPFGATCDDTKVSPLTRGAVKKLRKHMVWGGERPREQLWVRVFLTTGLPSASLFFDSFRETSGGRECIQPTHPGRLCCGFGSHPFRGGDFHRRGAGRDGRKMQGASRSSDSPS